MINKLKENSIKKAYNTIISNKVVINNPEKKIKKVAVLLDDESLEHEILTDLLKKISFQEQQITVLKYRDFSKKDEISPEFFTNNDFGFKARLKSDNLNKFVKNSYDLLINYVKKPNLYTNTITLLSQAGLKVGFAGIDDRLYDLIIQEKEFKETILNQELKKYLTILNKL